MTQKTTPRDALEDVLFDMPVFYECGKLNRDPIVDAILTALAPYLRTPGTVEVCKLCGVDVAQLSSFFKEKCRGNIKSDNYTTNCTLKQVTNEKV